MSQYCSCALCPLSSAPCCLATQWHRPTLSTRHISSATFRRPLEKFVVFLFFFFFGTQSEKRKRGKASVLKCVLCSCAGRVLGAAAMALNNSKPLIFISSRGPRVDANDAGRGGEASPAAGCGCVGKMTLESSGNFGYFVCQPARHWHRGEEEEAWPERPQLLKCGHVQLAADK